MNLYAATSNAGKLAEFLSAAASALTGANHGSLRVLQLPNLSAMPEPAEDAPTFLGNAERKAIAYSNLAPGLLVFADDSGLEAAALDGAPGVRSARFADDLRFDVGIGSTDERNNRALLHRLQSQRDRSARFVCAIALARSGTILLHSEGSVEGQILPAPRGADGFGYDPLFVVPSLDLTFAELSREAKWELSHRGRAFRSLLTQICAAPF